jgi:hypothetical protein
MVLKNIDHAKPKKKHYDIYYTVKNLEILSFKSLLFWCLFVWASVVGLIIKDNGILQDPYTNCSSRKVALCIGM